MQIPWLEIGLVLLLVVINAAFAGSEVALISLREGQLRRLEQEVPRLGYPLLTPPGSTSPIITFATKDGTLIEKRLAAGRVAARVSRYWFRFSPSVYNDMNDVERALELP